MGRLVPHFGMDPGKHRDGLELQCKGKKNGQGFQDGLGFWHFARLGRFMEEPAAMGG